MFMLSRRDLSLPVVGHILGAPSSLAPKVGARDARECFSETLVRAEMCNHRQMYPV